MFRAALWVPTSRLTPWRNQQYPCQNSPFMDLHPTEAESSNSRSSDQNSNFSDRPMEVGEGCEWIMIVIKAEHCQKSFWSICAASNIYANMYDASSHVWCMYKMIQSTNCKRSDIIPVKASFQGRSWCCWPSSNWKQTPRSLNSTNSPNWQQAAPCPLYICHFLSKNYLNQYMQFSWIHFRVAMNEYHVLSLQKDRPNRSGLKELIMYQLPLNDFCQPPKIQKPKLFKIFKVTWEKCEKSNDWLG